VPWAKGAGGRGYAAYARLVVGDDEDQAEYHQGNGWQFERVASAAAAARKDAAITKAVRELIGRLMGG
jgi:hypothetical protein